MWGNILLMAKEMSTEKDGFPGKPTSVWMDTTSETDYPALNGKVKTDAVIVGGGIAGILTAYSLLEAGIKVVLLESGRVAEDVTAYTTAKVTSAHGAMYHYLTEKFGEDKAKLYADANQAGLLKIVSIILNRKIDCELRKQSAYIYTEKAKNRGALKKEAEAARRLGLPARYTEDTPLAFIKGVVEYQNQAQFHPRKFLLDLANDISKEALLFENSRAIKVQEDGKNVTVFTGQGEVEAKSLIIATHFPFYDKERFYTKLYPHRSYVLGLKLKTEVPDGMYFSIDGMRNSIRNQGLYGKKILLVGGGTERAGVDADTLKYYERIRTYADERFDVEEIEYHWFTQDNRTPDRLPYIGKMSGAKNIYVAAGFGGWGMTTSAAASTVLTDLILGKVNTAASLFDPARKVGNRLGPIEASISENVKTFTHLLERYTKRYPFELPAGFEPGEGKIVSMRGRKVAIYKDKEGKIYSLSPVCKHMGCNVGWNVTEKTWDCPCHGSRYNYDGKVIHGPANEDLDKIDI